MKEYLSHFSAAAFWNIPYIEAVLEPEVAEADSVDFINMSMYLSPLTQAMLQSGELISVLAATGDNPYSGIVKAIE